MKRIEDNQQFIASFRHSAPYIHAHRKKTFVILIDGSFILSRKISSIIHDIALMNTLGVRIVLVYGIRAQIDAELKARNIVSEFHLGNRITSYEVLDIIKQVSGKCRFELEAQFSFGLPETPMHGANIRSVSGNFITAKPLGVLEGKDFLFTGGVRKVDAVAIEHLLTDGNIVMVSNVGLSTTGECFNLASEEVAIAIAAALKADKFIVYANTADCDTLPRELVPEQARALLAKTPNYSLNCLVNACEAGVERSHMINFDIDGALLLELFTTNGIGTLLSRNPFESIRDAVINDVNSIISLLAPLEAQGILVKRDREVLEREIEHFIVIERDGIIIACSALYPYGQAAEIACVVTHPDYRRGGRGDQMLDYLEKKARSLGISEVFVLTTQTAHFFIEQGFRESSPDNLPAEKKALYNFQRNSKVFSKTL